MRVPVRLMLFAVAAGLAPLCLGQQAQTGPPAPAAVSANPACAGFKSPDECFATMHLAKNLNIPFMDVRNRVVRGQTLERVVHELKPDVDSKAEVQRAIDQAHQGQHPAD
jgi:hypothetical protein